jgi:L-lactate dehydrogenase (cytochrome)
VRRRVVQIGLGWPAASEGNPDREDAKLALDHGADGVIISNRGGRQLEGAISSVQALPEVAEAVGDKLEVILDGGIRRGADVVRARALGAKACMVGRAWLYGLASGGQPGVERALEILRDEIDVTLTLLGRPTLAEIDRRILQA